MKQFGEMILIVEVEKGLYSKALNSIFLREKKPARCLQGNARVKERLRKSATHPTRDIKGGSPWLVGVATIDGCSVPHRVVRVFACPGGDGAQAQLPITRSNLR